MSTIYRFWANSLGLDCNKILKVYDEIKINVLGKKVLTDVHYDIQ